MSLKLLFDRQGIYIYPWYISDLVITEDIKKITGHSISQVFMVFRQGTVNGYFDISSSEKIGQQLLERVIKDRKFFRQVIKNIKQKSLSLLSFIERVDRIKSVSSLSNEQLLDIYSEYIDFSRELRLWGWVPVMLDGFNTSFLTNYIIEKFTIFLQSKNCLDKLPEYYTLLSSSEKMSSIQKEELARLELLLKISRLDKKVIKALENNNKKAIKASSVYRYIEQHRQRFASLTYKYTGPAMSEEYLIKLMRVNIKAGSLLKQKRKIINHHREIKGKQVKLATKLKLSVELKYLFLVSAEMMAIKDYRKSVYQKSYLSLDKIMGEIAKRLELSLSEVKFLIYKELKVALFKSKNYYTQLAKSRANLCCYRMRAGKIKIYQGLEAKRLISQIEKITKEKPPSQQKRVSGTIAFSGKVKGRVKIVLVSADVAKVKIGDILISSATNPDLLLAMKKAAAFVTDTGGIISHAAIIAREMMKPCIVGTKNASKIFQDGDQVLVDADQGIVEII